MAIVLAGAGVEPTAISDGKPYRGILHVPTCACPLLIRVIPMPHDDSAVSSFSWDLVQLWTAMRLSGASASTDKKCYAAYRQKVLRRIMTCAELLCPTIPCEFQNKGDVSPQVNTLFVIAFLASRFLGHVVLGKGGHPQQHEQIRSAIFLRELMDMVGASAELDVAFDVPLVALPTVRVEAGGRIRLHAWLEAMQDSIYKDDVEHLMSWWSSALEKDATEDGKGRSLVMVRHSIYTPSIGEFVTALLYYEQPTSVMHTMALAILGHMHKVFDEHIPPMIEFPSTPEGWAGIWTSSGLKRPRRLPVEYLEALGRIRLQGGKIRHYVRYLSWMHLPCFITELILQTPLGCFPPPPFLHVCIPSEFVYVKCDNAGVPG